MPWTLQHLSTQVTSQASRCALGQTFWAWHGSEGDLGLAWDWVQIFPGVVAMADPMAVLTNLRLVGDAGEVLTASEAAVRVNCVVHALPWQLEVERALQSSGSALPEHDPEWHRRPLTLPAARHWQ